MAGVKTHEQAVSGDAMSQDGNRMALIADGRWAPPHNDGCYGGHN
jgi:hypothetical protein